jgi:uncharacterized protein (TIRG00374 family)
MAFNERAKDFLSLLVRVGLSVLLLVFIFSKIDKEKTISVLKTADPQYILVAVIIFLFIHGLLLLRWNIFIRALDLKTPLMDVARFFFVGLFGNLFLPSSIGGDIIKVLGLCKNSSQKPRVVASVLLDRLSGFASIVVVAVCSFIFGYKLINSVSVLIPIAVMAAGSLVIVTVLFNEKMYEFGCRMFNGVPKIKNSLMQMHYDIALLKDKKWEGLKAVALSCCSQFILASTYYFSAKALHQDIPLIYFLIFVPIICVASSFPSIGGLGVREAGAAYLFTKVGVDSGIAVSLSLMNFLFMVMVGLLGGLFYVVTLSSGRIQHSSPDAGVKPARS